MTHRSGIVVLVSAVFCGSVAGQEAKPEAWSGTPEQNELVRLIDDLYDQYNAYYTQAEKITDPEKQRQYYKEHDPALVAMPKLLAFEARHAGTDEGLMAMRRIMLLAASGGPANNPRDQARREAFQRLPNYANRPIVVDIVRYVDAGNFEPAAESFLRSLAEDRKAAQVVSEYAKITLACWMLGSRDARVFSQRRLQELAAGGEERFAGERDYYADSLGRLPDERQLDAWQPEALRLLKHAGESTSLLRQPAVTGIDPKWHLIRLDEQATEEMPRLSELAVGLLFKESHLHRGKPAPALAVSLIGGHEWSLAEQRGKAVILQFSFKGCGPCEAMYPDLRELQKQYGERLAILSIMADRERKDTDEAVTNGKLTWNVAWDGFRGPVATRWAVQGFPKVYVVSPKGEIVGTDLRDKQLKQKIAELLP